MNKINCSSLKLGILYSVSLQRKEEYRGTLWSDSLREASLWVFRIGVLNKNYYSFNHQIKEFIVKLSFQSGFRSAVPFKFFLPVFSQLRRCQAVLHYLSTSVRSEPSGIQD